MDLWIFGVRYMHSMLSKIKISKFFFGELRPWSDKVFFTNKILDNPYMIVNRTPL